MMALNSRSKIKQKKKQTNEDDCLIPQIANANFIQCREYLIYDIAAINYRDKRNNIYFSLTIFLLQNFQKLRYSDLEDISFF